MLDVASLITEHVISILYVRFPSVSVTENLFCFRVKTSISYAPGTFVFKVIVTAVILELASVTVKVNACVADTPTLHTYLDTCIKSTDPVTVCSSDPPETEILIMSPASKLLTVDDPGRNVRAGVTDTTPADNGKKESFSPAAVYQFNTYSAESLVFLAAS
jgi:hypothetical protein